MDAERIEQDWREMERENKIFSREYDDDLLRITLAQIAEWEESLRFQTGIHDIETPINSVAAEVNEKIKAAFKGVPKFKARLTI